MKSTCNVQRKSLHVKETSQIAYKNETFDLKKDDKLTSASLTDATTPTWL